MLFIFHHHLTLRFFKLIVLLALGFFIHTSQASNTFNVGVSHYAPFQQFDKQGDLHGIDIDILNAVLVEAGYSAKYVKMPWARQIQVGIKNGELDILLQAKRTQKREAFAYFSNRMYMHVENALFIQTKDNDKFKDIRQLDDLIGTKLSIGVARGAAYSEKYAELSHDPQFISRIITVNKDEQNIGMLLSGRTDGFLATDLSTMHLLKNHPKGGQVKIHMQLETNDVLSRGSVYMFSKKTMSVEQVAAINKALNKLLDNGTIGKIIEKHRQLKKGGNPF